MKSKKMKKDINDKYRKMLIACILVSIVFLSGWVLIPIGDAQYSGSISVAVGRIFMRIFGFFMILYGFVGSFILWVFGYIPLRKMRKLRHIIADGSPVEIGSLVNAMGKRESAVMRLLDKLFAQGFLDDYIFSADKMQLLSKCKYNEEQVERAKSPDMFR